VIAEIVSLSRDESQVSALLNEEERMAMEFFIACAPEDHPVMPGAGGFRKAHWARRGMGKRCGLRVVHFFLTELGRICMAAIYAQSHQETLSAADQNVLAKLAERIKKAAKGGRRSWGCAVRIPGPTDGPGPAWRWKRAPRRFWPT
jgi:hypothetical protein